LGIRKLSENVERRLVDHYGYNPYFANRMYSLLGDEALDLAEADLKPVRKAIRINRLKADPDSILRRLEKKGFTLERINWVSDGYWVNGGPPSPRLGATDEYLLGYYYIQSPVSIFIAEYLNPKPGEVVLDLAAGPGGKTTYVSQLMENSGGIVAVEPKRDRVSALRSNVSRMACENVVVLQTDGRWVSSLGLTFDRVLLDAPCTASGLVSNHPKLKKRINAEDVGSQSLLQRSLAEVGFSVLRRGGTMVYSTCSLLPEEGEDIVRGLVNKEGAVIQFAAETRQGEYRLREGFDCKGAIRFYHHVHDTEGFFVCKMLKP
jgi:NOL1/NOP2/sun family putative RNA methylase